jgi:hypothetical protein
MEENNIEHFGWAGVKRVMDRIRQPGFVCSIPSAISLVTAMSLPFLPLDRAIVFPFKGAARLNNLPDAVAAGFGSIPGQMVFPRCLPLPIGRLPTYVRLTPLSRFLPVRLA